jgi:hypothetical protein
MNWNFIVVARKTARLVDELKAAQWKRSPRTDADGQCEFFYQPEGWGKAFRLLALRYEKTSESRNSDKAEQYQLFDTPEYTYRVFVTDMDGALDTLVWFYNQRAAAENLIKEANNDAGLTAHPSNRWMMNANWFQIAMLAYNLNCWLQLFSREESVSVDTIKHTTLATARLRFLSASCSLPPESGATLAGWASATAITIRRKVRSNSSWTVSAKSLADRMDLLPSCLRRYVPDSTGRIAHRFLCTGRLIDPNTCRAGREDKYPQGKAEPLATDKLPPLNRQVAPVRSGYA